MPASSHKKLLFVDDDASMHVGLRFMLKNDYDLTCVFSGEEAVEAVARETFPVVILDLQMEGLSGLETLKLLHKGGKNPPKIIILTGHDTKESAIEALNLGAFRYLLKPFEKDELMGSLEAAYKRFRLEEAAVACQAPAADLFGGRGLSKRQREIAKLVIQGKSNREIALRFDISERTVEKHMEQILSLLNVSSRAKLAADQICLKTICPCRASELPDH